LRLLGRGGGGGWVGVAQLLLRQLRLGDLEGGLAGGLGLGGLGNYVASLGLCRGRAVELPLEPGVLESLVGANPPRGCPANQGTFSVDSDTLNTTTFPPPWLQLLPARCMSLDRSNPNI
jgi:hypothetical protein